MTKLTFCAILLLGLTRTAFAPAAQMPGAVAVGGTLPQARLRGLNGPSRELDEFRGKPLMINVWASWCGPCRAEMASLERLAWSEDAHAFTLIGISTDDDAELAKAWLKSSNTTISQFIDTDLQMETLLGASRLPLTVFVDAHGRVLKRIYGAKQWDGASARQIIHRVYAAGSRLREP
jgi:thiol-disulfide isomerase/thioredoxin